jgi:serine/threonine-protein kinase
VHRDITPKNILISYDGFVKLIDFGVAFAKGRITNTRTGVVKGTIGYMAPEQLQGKSVDRRIDIFALGVMLYKLTTGEHPFPGATDEEQMHRLLKGSYPPVRSLVPDADPALEATIHKALATDPKQRHPTAEKLGQELKDLLVPQGGPVDNAYLAKLMTRVFSKEISKQDNALQRALAMSVPPNSGFASQGDETDDKARSNRPGNLTLQGWQTNSPKHTKKSRRHTAIAVVAATTALFGFLIARYNGQDKAIAQEPTSRSSETSSETTHPAPNAVPSVGANQNSRDTGNNVEPQKSFYLLLKGVPDSARVLLAGNEEPLVGGKIAVPADGARRELNVIADGYLPYSQFIAPGEDGELSVQLEKKRDAHLEAIHTHKLKGKTKGKKLLSNPYSKQ